MSASVRISFVSCLLLLNGLTLVMFYVLKNKTKIMAEGMGVG